MNAWCALMVKTLEKYKKNRSDKKTKEYIPDSEEEQERWVYEEPKVKMMKVEEEEPRIKEQEEKKISIVLENSSGKQGARRSSQHLD